MRQRSAAGIDMLFRPIRLEPQRFLKTRQGVGGLAQSLVGQTEVEMVFRDLRLRFDRLSQRQSSLVATARLQSENTEQMVGVGVLWICLQDLAVKLLRVAQIARLMISRSQSQQLS